MSSYVLFKSRSAKKSLLLLGLSLCTLVSSALSQTVPSEQQGATPYGSYEGGNVDTVNMMNGNVSLHIPVYSLPQRGQLGLSFSLVLNNNGYHYTKTCASDGTGCSYTYSRFSTSPNPIGPSVVMDQAAAIRNSYTNYQIGGTQGTVYTAEFFSVLDPSGASHPLGFDNSNLAHLRATDGSGYLYVPNNPTAYNYSTFSNSPLSGSLYTPAGTKLTLFGGQPTAITDKDGNSIALSSAITDSLGRNLTFPPNAQTTSSTVGCPVLNFPYQALTGSSTWSVPGANGSTQNYLFCYTSVHYQTNFWGNGGQDVIFQPWGNCDCEARGTQTVLQSVVLPNGTYWTFDYDAADPANNASVGYGDLLSVSFPTGGTITYNYANQAVCSTAAGNNRAAVQRTLAAGDGTQYSWNYSVSAQGSRISTDPLLNDTVYTFTSIGPTFAGVCNPLFETNRQVYKGSQSAGILLSSTATTYQYALNPQVMNTAGSPATAVFPTTVKTTLDTGVSTTTTYSYSDGGFVNAEPKCTSPTNCPTNFQVTPQQTPFGLKTAVTSTDYSGTTLRTTQIQYLYQQNSSYLAANLLNPVASTTVLNGSGTQVSKTTFGFDENNGSPQGIFGHQTSVNRWLNTTNTYLTSKTVYNTQGMPTQSINPLNNTTKYSYDTTGAFVSQVQSPDTTTQGVVTHHIANYTYDPVVGKALTYSNQNGQTTSYTYDILGRLATVHYPDFPVGTQTSYCYTDEGGSTCSHGSAPYQMVSTSPINTTQIKTTATTYDGFGRPTTTALTSDPDGATYTVSVYDALGRVGKTYNPTRCATPTTNCGESTWGYTTVTFDALGRTTSVTLQDGAITSTTYSGNATTVTDPAGKSRRSVVDALSRLTQVFEDPSGLNYETDYTYDALDNLLTVNQKGGSTVSSNWRTRTFTFDSLSRMITASNPESGTVSYSYDANGNLLQKTSPAPNQMGTATVTLSYCYDALNRTTGKAYTAQTCSNGLLPTPLVSYFYDQTSYNGLSITNPVGNVTGMSDQAGSEALSYDSVGRIISDQRVTIVPGTSNTVSKDFVYTYNFDGSLSTLNMPVDAQPRHTTLTYQPGGAGRPLSMTGYASSAHYSPSGALCSIQQNWAHYYYTNTTFNNRLQPIRMQSDGEITAPTGTPCVSQSGTANTIDLAYNFVDLSGHNNGNVASITNNRDNTRSQNFTYDSLNRISTAQTQTTGVTIPNANCWGLTYGYDPWGNLQTWSTTGPSGCSEPLPLNIAVTTANRVSTNTVAGTVTNYCYDSAGNLIHTIAAPGTCPATGPYQYTYDAENHLISAASVNYAYGGDGKRLTKSNGTIYWYGTNSDALIESDFSLNLKFIYVYFNGQRIARSDATNLVTFYFTDHLGTARAVWNLNGQDESDFYPFGGERPITSGVGNRYKFTGKERDSESGLDNFTARYFGSSLGRFMSPDPENAGATDDDPQSWNAYAYVINNPMNDVDPDGRADDPDPCAKDPAHCVQVTANAPSIGITRISYVVRDIADKANQLLHVAYRAVVNSRVWCIAAYTASGAVAGGTVGAETGATVGATYGLAGFAGGPTGFATTAAGGGTGGIIGGVGGGFAGGALGFHAGQALCSSGTGGGNGGGSSEGTTTHGAQRLNERGFTPEDIADTKTGTTMTQTDGATVYVKGVGQGKYNILVEGDGGNIVTAMKNKSSAEVRALAERYGWHM